MSCAPSVSVTEHEAALDAAEAEQTELATQLETLTGDVEELTGEITSLQRLVDLAEERLVERDATILELEREVRTMRQERDAAVEQTSALLLAFDDQIQAARAQLATELLIYACQQAATDTPPSSAESAVASYLDGSPEAVAALAGFDVESLIDLAATQAELDRCQAEAELRAPKGSGFYTVGVEIAPGQWRSTGTGDGCYWERLNINQDIIANHFGEAGGTVTIRSTDYEIHFSDCGTWEFVG